MMCLSFVRGQGVEKLKRNHTKLFLGQILEFPGDLNWWRCRLSQLTAVCNASCNVVVSLFFSVSVSVLMVWEFLKYSLTTILWKGIKMAAFASVKNTDQGMVQWTFLGLYTSLWFHQIMLWCVCASMDSVVDYPWTIPVAAGGKIPNPNYFLLGWCSFFLGQLASWFTCPKTAVNLHFCTKCAKLFGIILYGAHLRNSLWAGYKVNCKSCLLFGIALFWKSLRFGNLYTVSACMCVLWMLQWKPDSVLASLTATSMETWFGNVYIFRSCLSVHRFSGGIRKWNRLNLLCNNRWKTFGS